MQGEGVRFGLGALKGVGVGATQSIIEEREKGGEFKSFTDFVYRCAPFLNKRMLEGLINAGAFDEFGIYRSRLNAVYSGVLDRANKNAKEKQSLQMSLFGDILEDNIEEIEYPDIPEYETNERLAKEKATLGVYVSGHPFENYVNAFNDCNFSCLKMQNYEEDEDGHRTYPELTDGAPVTMGGIISTYKRINTRSGAAMAFITVEDLYGSIECVAFPYVYERIRSAVSADKVVRLSGKLQLDDEKAPVILLDKLSAYGEEETASELSAAAPVRPVKREPALWLNATALTEEEFDEFTMLFSHYAGGNTTVKIKRGKQLFKMNNINDCRGLRDELVLYLEESDIVQV